MSASITLNNEICFLDRFGFSQIMARTAERAPDPDERMALTVASETDFLQFEALASNGLDVDGVMKRIICVCWEILRRTIPTDEQGVNPDYFYVDRTAVRLLEFLSGPGSPKLHIERVEISARYSRREHLCEALAMAHQDGIDWVVLQAAIARVTQSVELPMWFDGNCRQQYSPPLLWP